jgi:pyruvate/2-oxoglutarate dehydrogenase complex dihydrolipoamide acyltransferase (E2) component
MYLARPMLIPILLPELGSTPVVFGVWHVAIGDLVMQGERLAEVRIRGAVIDLAAPEAGIFREQFVRPLDTLQPGQTLGTLEPN